MSKKRTSGDEEPLTRGNAHQKLFEAYKIAYPGWALQKAQRLSQVEWADILSKFKGDDKSLLNHVVDRIKFYQRNALKQAMAFKSHFVEQSKVNQAESNDSANLSRVGNTSQLNPNKELPHSSFPSEQPSTSSNASSADQNEPLQASTTRLPDNVLKRSYPTPAQDECRAKIHVLESQLNADLLWRNNMNMGSVDEERISETRKELNKQKQNLRTKKNNVKHQQKNRDSKKRKKEIDNDGVIRTVGRPRIEETQLGILDCLKEFALHGAGAHDRRRSDIIRPVSSVSELHELLLTMGYQISRSAMYTRVLPRNSHTNEGKRHVKTVPIKFTKAQNNSTKWHPDAHFCTASIRLLESLASLIGPELVFFLSQDDEARVHIGVRAANKQSAILMHVDYKVSLPDHDFVVGSRHKLIPSVYAGIVIKPGGLGDPKSVSYSGPTYVAIRSGKHDSSTAASHAADFKRLLQLENFLELSKIDGRTKPIVIISADGGPDENPRYPKVISWGIELFINENLDGLFVVTNAPGHSKYNRAERRMAPLSNQLAGVVLQHDKFGSHLKGGKTVNKELERKNFAHAGETLAELWNEMVLDSHPVHAEYIHPLDEELKPRAVDEQWYLNHVRESQYLLQISKCQDKACCSPPRSNLRSILPTGFLPSPTLVHNEKGTGILKAVPLGEEHANARFLPLFQRLALVNLEIPNPDGFKKIPYDLYCPSVRSELSGRICKTCGIYFVTKKAATDHMKSLNHAPVKAPQKSRIKRIEAQRKEEVLCIMQEHGASTLTAEWIMEDHIQNHDTDDCIDNREKERDESDQFPEIKNLPEWLESPWVLDAHS
ncbi:hypothetical protein QAD02_007932 [Eretmocerus hayati]|uniref:Uncharacterized protein n=1 Tax=Eretmocerus hayati TaxID=131215 RepID=A0ACC2N9E5_9HYME|nr:hypothetical protein QAD02_007932 [Eretmocerus hayati]